ncbi:hypothetical protein BDW42DRAFT_172301 [Aspergillus taichungensis]|uniref:Uncharacterized protein n=1 Tax=Aspergillus taichungensis TaxID=482145 RepID=A0A2J5HR20_9EURO|nr:hypothetical protein BDW42DRAFT_172301 [Aspergillus taichungensis]
MGLAFWDCMFVYLMWWCVWLASGWLVGWFGASVRMNRSVLMKRKERKRKKERRRKHLLGFRFSSFGAFLGSPC